MKTGKQGVGRDIILNGESHPVIEEGDRYIEIPDRRFIWGVRELVREGVLPSMPIKNGPGVMPVNIIYKAADIEEITWGFCEGRTCYCTIRMKDGSVCEYLAPKEQDVSHKHLLRALLESKSPKGNPGRRAIHGDEVIAKACAWIYRLHVQEGMNQIPAAKKAIAKHHLSISPGWLLQQYREEQPKHWLGVLREIQGSMT